jgi:hypothetical protein
LAAIAATHSRGRLCHAATHSRGRLCHAEPQNTEWEMR